MCLDGVPVVANGTARVFETPTEGSYGARDRSRPESSALVVAVIALLPRFVEGRTSTTSSKRAESSQYSTWICGTDTAATGGLEIDGKDGTGTPEDAGNKPA